MTFLRARLSGMAALSRESRLLLLMTTLFGFGYGGIGLMLRPLYVLRLGLGPAYYGAYSALGSLAFMAGSLGAGWLGMRLGARRSLMLGTIGCLLGSGLMPLTEFFDASLWLYWPIASNLLLSWAWAFVSVNTVPALTGVTAEENRDRAIGLANTLNGLGILLGNLLGGALPRAFSALLGVTAVTNDGFRLAISTALLFGVVVIALVLALPDRPTIISPTLAGGAPQSATPLLVVGLFGLFIPAASSAVSTFAAPYLDQELRLSTEAIGLVTTISQALAVLGTGATPWLARRLTSRRGDILAGLGMTLTLLPMAAFAHWSAAVFSRIVSSALYTIRFPLTQMFAMAQVRQHERPLLSAVLFTSAGLCGTALSFVGGRLAASHGYQAVFWLSAAVSGVAVLLYAVTTRVLIARGRLRRA
ncbi:MAG: MFS transporter [Anaerolineae bacterium]